MATFRNFYDHIKWIVVTNADAALTNGAYYPVSGAFIDTRGFDRVAFLISMATVGTPDFSIYQAVTISGTPKAVTSAAKTDVVTADDNEWFSIEFSTAKMDTANGYRYVTCLVAAGSSTDYAHISCLLWRGNDIAVSQAAGYYDAVVLGG